MTTPGGEGSYKALSSSEASSERPTPLPSVVTMTPRESAELTCKHTQQGLQPQVAASIIGYDHRKKSRAHLEAEHLGAELDTDETEHDRHGLLEVDEVGDGDREQLVEAAQPDDGGDVGGVHDEGVAGDAEHGGDRVDGEEHVAQRDAHERAGELRRLQSGQGWGRGGEVACGYGNT